MYTEEQTKLYPLSVYPYDPPKALMAEWIGSTLCSLRLTTVRFPAYTAEKKTPYMHLPKPCILIPAENVSQNTTAVSKIFRASIAVARIRCGLQFIQSVQTLASISVLHP